MDDAGTKKRHRSRSPHTSHHKSVKKKCASRHRGDSSSPSPPRRHSTLSKYNAEVSRKEERKRGKRKVSVSSSSSSSSSRSPERKKKKKKAEKSSSSSSSDSSSSSSSSSDESSDTSKHKRRQKKKRHRKGKKKLKKKSKKAKKKSLSKVKSQETKSRAEEPHHGPPLQLQQESSEEIGPVLTDEQKSRIQAMKPMTKEEWDARQSIIRKVLDPETGRMRLIKGDGEVLEEIVSRDRHKEINKQATASDGLTFHMRSGML